MSGDIPSGILEFCPIFSKPCIKEGCVGYRVSTRQRFKDLLTNKYISVDALGFYSTLSPEQLAERFLREVKVVRECDWLHTIISMEDYTDHNLPNTEFLIK